MVDGDTFVADIDLGFHIWINKRIRLLGIHAPEPKGETTTAGKAAIECLRKLIDAKSIIIRTVKGSDGADRDDDGRWLVVAYLDGLEVNNSMLSKAAVCRIVDPRRAATAPPRRARADWPDALTPVAFCSPNAEFFRGTHVDGSAKDLVF